MKPNNYTIEEFKDNALPIPVISPYHKGYMAGEVMILGYGNVPHLGKKQYYLKCFCGVIFTTKSITNLENKTKPSCGCNALEQTRIKKFKTFLELCENNKPQGYDLSTITMEDWSSGTVKVVCPHHGEQSVDLRFRHGSSCFSCGKDKMARKAFKTTDMFIDGAVKVHGDRYGYRDTVYKGSHEKVTIFCKESKTYFTPTATDHLSGYGCKCCAVGGGIDYDSPTNLYISLWTNNNKELDFYKIGITNRDPQVRLEDQESRSTYTGRLIESRYYKNGRVAHSIEKQLLKKITVQGTEKKHFKDGYTETFLHRDLPTILSYLEELGEKET